MGDKLYYKTEGGKFHNKLGCATTLGDAKFPEQITKSEAQELDPCGVCVTQDEFLGDQSVMYEHEFDDTLTAGDLEGDIDVLYRAKGRGTASTAGHLNKDCKFLVRATDIIGFEPQTNPTIDICNLCRAYAHDRGDLE